MTDDMKTELPDNRLRIVKEFKLNLDFGIEETLDVVESLVKLANGIKASMEDGKFTFSDSLNFTGFLVSLPSALSGLKFIPAEVGNLNPEEVSALVEVVKTELDWADDAKAQIIINKALVIGLAIQDLVEAVDND